MVCWKRSFSVYLLALNWNLTFGWRWKTEDAIIQDVWPEDGPEKFKRASPTETVTTTSADQLLPSTALEAAPIDQDEDESMLVFEGRYFKPNEVPPPPPFMMANNWRGGGGESSSPKVKPKHPQSKTSNNFYYVASVGTPSRFPPVTQKFTEENAKDFGKAEKNENIKSDSEEKLISSSNSKNVIASSSVPHLENLHYYEEQFVSEDEFHDAPKCFTATDSQGRCVLFKHCYPVVFNVIDGELRNPGLAKLLYQSSGPCNASLEFDFALSNKKNDKTFLNSKFYNQSICCPKFKHPPTFLRSSREDISKNSQQKLTTDAPKSNSSKHSPFAAPQSEDNVEKYVFIPIGNKNNRPLGPDDSSVELFQTEYSSGSDENDGDFEMDELILGDDGNMTEEENIRMSVAAEIVKENSTTAAVRVEDSEGEDDEIYEEERRGDRDKGSSSSNNANTKKPVEDAFSAVPAPNLTPNKCRHQIYGMPRGHWPWMVALVISSRHICSGALIDERHVITGAHCVAVLDDANMRKLRIIIGDRVMYSSIDGPHFWRKITKITTHKNYNQQTFASDIAILKMNSNVPFSRNVQPISLSDQLSPVDSNTFSKGIVAGWSGADIGQPSFEARTEVETVVDIMEKSHCREIYRGFALSGVATNTFCTKPANNTCVADSGAPLIVREQNCWILAGIMSWGLGCSHFPEVYTDVTRYTSWIRKHLV